MLAAAGFLHFRWRQNASSQVQAQAHQQSVCVLKFAMGLQDAATAKEAAAKEATAAEEAKAAAEDKKGDKKDDKKVGLPLSVLTVT